MTTAADLRLLVDRSGLSSGTHKTKVVVASGNQSIDIEVSVEVDSHTPTQPAKVQLLDGMTRVVVSTTTNSLKAFLISGVDPGRYVLRVGLDVDRNGSFRDTGDWSAPDRNVVIAEGELWNVGKIRLTPVR